MDFRQLSPPADRAPDARIGRATTRLRAHGAPWPPLRSPLTLLPAGALVLALAFTTPAAKPETPAGPAIDFAQTVAPILQRHCLACHDAASAPGGLILESRAQALAHNGALVPGDPDASLLLKMIDGPEPAMPENGPPLAPEDVETLRQWIAAGAPWPESLRLASTAARDLDWWSLQPIPPTPAPTPATGDPANHDHHPPAHPVDQHLDRALAQAGLQPVDQADPVTLIRRVSHDLTGLPPDPVEVDRFVAHHQQDPEAAWHDLVDRLLASPAFGERFARHWLDLARYADSHGYDKDQPRPHAWPYRDYVIRSLNEDKPLDRFVREQVAGDVLYPDDPDGVLGLGFLAAGPWDQIAHHEVGEDKLDGRIAKHLDRDEMAAAVFNVFLSTTLQCAQCHHHKSDPLRMEDYYRVQAVFAAVDRAERVYTGLDSHQQQQLAELTAERDRLRQEVADLQHQADEAQAGPTAAVRQRLDQLRALHPPGEPPSQHGYHSHISDRRDEAKWLQLDLGAPVTARSIRLRAAHDNFAGIGSGFGFPVRFRVEVSDQDAFGPGSGARVLHDSGGTDHPNPRTRPVGIDAGDEPFRFVRVTATRLAPRQGDFIFALAELEVVADDGSNLAAGATVTALDSIEQGPRWGMANVIDGRYHLELSDPDALTEYHDLLDRLGELEQRHRCHETGQQLAAARRQLEEVEQQRAALPEGRLVYAAATRFESRGRFHATNGQPRPIHLLRRGDLESPAEPMTPGAPPLWPGAADRFFPDLDPADAGAGSNGRWDEGEARAHLARYLTADDNPLLWRSLANRLWQWVHGRPLVASPNDFGRGGQTPSHPELLDELAARLRDDPDRSLKSVVRLLVTSRAYRRSSAHDPDNAAIDGDNRLLWRANRRRLSAEEIRDSALAAAGALDPAAGGPGFQDFVIEHPQHSPHYQYHLHDHDDPAAHRRSIYRFVVRSQPQPMLTTLDCADPSLSVPLRDESTTALQALTQWNHGFIEAMSRRFGERLQNEAGDDPDAVVELACRLLLGRGPDAAERAILTEHLHRHGAASLARVMFNLNAFVYVD